MPKIKKVPKKSIDQWVLKIILNIWSIVTIALFTADFLSGNMIDSHASAAGIIYLAILGIYAGEKEYIRWNNQYKSRYIGESYVIIWTVIMAVFVILAPFSDGKFHIPDQLAIVYSSVIGIFAATRHSRQLKESQGSRAKKPLSKKK